MTSAKAKIYFIGGTIILLLASALLFSLFTINRLQNNVKIQVHTRTIMLTLKENIICLLEAETNVNDFIVTGDSNYLPRYASSLQKIKINIAQLDTLTLNAPIQRQNLRRLSKLIERKISFSKELMVLKKQADEQSIKTVLASNKSEYLLDRMLLLNRNMQALETRLFAQRQLATATSIANAKSFFIIGFILSLLITIFLILMLIRELTKRTKAEERISKINIELERKNKDLETKSNFIKENEKRIVSIMDALLKTTQLDFSEKLCVSDRGDELDAIAVGLNTMSEELEFHLQQLRLSEEKLNAAQRLARIGNWEWDMATNKVQWSDEMFNLYGYGNERFDVSFDKALDRMLPEDAANTKARLKENVEQAVHLFKEKGILEFESTPNNYTLIWPDGNKKVVEGIGKLMLNAEGQVIKMAGTVQDIDEQFKAQEKLNQYNIELVRKNQEIAQFAYAASHDLQEPLRSISNFCRLLAEKLAPYPDRELHEYMNLISGGASRMSNLIFALLEYSRIGKDVSKRPTDCDLLVHEILGDLAALIEETGATIHVEKLPVLNCHDLKSVFQNLIINAIKFKKKDIAPIVEISATETEKEFLFKIKDNGIGIEEEYYDRIFIIFQRLHLRTEYEGTGIGLSLIKKMIEMQGGKIWVESTFGEGSIFYFTLPK